MTRKIAFVASPVAAPQAALAELSARYGNVPIAKADVIVALGGDGFMLQTLHATQHIDLPVYGMNRGTVGFLLNAYAVDGLYERLAAAEMAPLNPLDMRAERVDGSVVRALAINEV